MKTYLFNVIDYHQGETGKHKAITTLAQLDKWARANNYNAVRPDFKNGILWVTSDNGFKQR